MRKKYSHALKYIAWPVMIWLMLLLTPICIRFFLKINFHSPRYLTKYIVSVLFYITPSILILWTTYRLLKNGGRMLGVFLNSFIIAFFCAAISAALFVLSLSRPSSSYRLCVNILSVVLMWGGKFGIFGGLLGVVGALVIKPFLKRQRPPG